MTSPSATESPIAVRGLNYAFGSGVARSQVLFNIDLQIERGSLTVLMGPSGSGKTTLLTLVGCLRDVQEGSVRLLGTELRGASTRARVDARRALGFIFQAHNLHNSLTATQNVVIGLQVHGRGDPKVHVAAADHALGLVGLGDRLHHRPAELSGGQKQRVAVARALVGNPEVVLADEPTAALDKVSSKNVVHLLKHLGRARGTTSIVVTHDPRILEDADRIVTLEDGRIASDTKQG